MPATIRYGVIGTGMMGIEHLRNLALLPEAEVVAVVDPVPTSLGWAREALGPSADGVTLFNDVGSFAAQAAKLNVDAVVIVTPNHTHRAVLERLFDLDVAILCEKPLATTLADARWIAGRAKGHSKPFWVGMEYRFMPAAAAFIAQVQAGRIGTLRMLSIREHRFPFLVKVENWNRFERNTGGTMVEKCCHFFDLMRLIVGSEAVRIYCSAGQDVNHLDERYGGKRPDIIDNSFTVVDFANGVRALLDLCMFAEGVEHQEEISATGDKARLDVLIPPGDLVFSPRTGFGGPKAVQRTRIEVPIEIANSGSHQGATYYQHAAFLATVQGQPVQVSGNDGLRAVEMGLAAEISRREHRAVMLDELRGSEH